MNKLAIIIVLCVVIVLAYYVYITQYARKPEVYLITSIDGSYQTSFADALNVARTFDSSATLATPDQINAAQAIGAQWCSTGWLSDQSRKFPMQMYASGCGGPGLQNWGPASPVANVTVYGVKPTQDQVTASGSKLKVLPFYGPATNAGDTKLVKWSQYDP